MPTLPAVTDPRCTHVGITLPHSGAELRGAITIYGSSSIQDFSFYKVEYSTSDQPNLWHAISDVFRNQVVNGVLEIWNTPAFPDGEYNLKLTVVDNSGHEVCKSVVSGLIIANGR